MVRRLSTVGLLALLLVVGVACGKNKHVKNPLAQVDSKQPDKVLFDRAMEAMKERKYDVARLSLQTMINAYPDSEFLSRAKLAIGDSWYYEGGSAALAQAENEYKDYQTFFPNTPEAAEAQLRVAEIHYKQMEKPDRDYTHAVRAEEEFRQLLLQYPDSQLVPQAKLKLLQVQEVLAEREYRIGRFYFLRESWAAAIARLKSLTDTYPLYSSADDALFMQGQAYESQVAQIRASNLPDPAKNGLIRKTEDAAAQAYSKIVTRYPAGSRADDATKRLQALDRPVPKPTEDAIALNKKEIESRGEVGKVGRTWANFKKSPSVSMAAATKVGEPTLVDPKQTDASNIVRGQAAELANSLLEMNKNNKVSVETVKDGEKVPESQAVPRSDQAATPDQPTTPPDQVNEVGSGSGNSVTATPVPDKGSAQANDAKGSKDSKSDSSSSKAKKKKKLGIF